MGKWADFWSVVQFIRNLTSVQELRRILFAGEFPELVWAQREVTIPSPPRTCVWFSGDATLIALEG